MAISKIIYKSSSSDTGTVWMDVTQKTVTAGSMLNGITALKNDGTGITGNIASKSSSNLTASGATVTAPAGYYASDASKSVSSMTLPTSTSSSATSGYSSKATVSRSTSDQYINIPPGYNSSGAYYKVSAVANGSATTPTTTITANPSISVNSSTGLITATASSTNSITPVVSAGYVSSGTAGTITVNGSNTSQLTTQAATTFHPSTTAQSITAGKYLTGAQTISAVTMENLTAANIKKDVVIKIGDSSDDDCVMSVTGTYEGSGNSTTWETVYIGTLTYGSDWGNGNAFVFLPLWYEPIELNSIWRVTWDNTVYECTATWGSSDGDGYAIGNYTLEAGGSGGTEYPFFIQAYGGSAVAYIVTATSGTHYIKIEKQTTENIMWETVHMGVYNIVGEDVGGYIPTNLKSFDAFLQNSVWRLTYNGTPYICIATQTASAIMNPDYGVGYAIGNYAIYGEGTDTGEPFLAGMFDWSPTELIIGTIAQSGSVSIRLERMVGNLIPKTITANGTYNAENDGVDGYSQVTVNVSGEQQTTWVQQYTGSVTVADLGEQLNYISLVNYFSTHSDFSYGEIYRITWKNSTQYTCVAEVEIPDGSWTGYVLGNGELWGEQFGNNEPFIAQRYGDDLLFPTTETVGTTFTLTIEKQVSGGLTLGGIRPDAEIAKIWTFDQLAVADLGKTLGNYSTSAITIQSALDLETATLDSTNYDYCIAMRQLAYPIYNTNTIAAGRFAFYACTYWQDFFELPAGTIRDGENVYSSAWSSSKTINQMFIAYYTSNEALNTYYTTSTTNMGGAYMYGNVTSTKSGNNYTPKSPTLYLKGHSTYYNQTFWEATTDIRYQYIMELWRVPKGNLNYDGYALSSQIVHAIDCYNSSGKTLT